VVFADADGSLDGADLPAEVLLGFGMADRGSGWALKMIARAGKVGLRVVEVPVRYRPAPAPQQGQRLAAGTVRAIGAMAVVTLALVRERRAHRVRRGKSLVSSGFSPRLPASLRCRSSARARGYDGTANECGLRHLTCINARVVSLYLITPR
jgi:hypothetical protein